MKFSASTAAHVQTIDKGQAFEFNNPSWIGRPGLRTRMLTNKQVLLAMKLTSILLLIACLQVNAKGFGQGTTVTISMKNVAVTEVFKEIEKQTTFRFLYRDELVKKAGLVTVAVKDASVQEVLDQCFARKPLDYKIFKETIVISEKEVSVKIGGGTGMIELPLTLIDVTGRVLNEKGEPVSGVTVTIKGTNTVTTTNSSGEFTLTSIDPEATLIFTHVSMETFELKVSGKTELAINLKTKISALGDVIVTVNTGYEKVPKERATGSFGFVNKEQLNRKAGTDILSRLEGVTTGIIIDRRQLSPDQSTISAKNVLIRGLSTLSDQIRSPLIVVDNFPYEGDINNINPNDVENITILKDAAAASIWGSRAGNGVIVITTKKGHYNQAFRLTLNNNIQIKQEPDLFEYSRMTSSDFIGFETFLFSRNFYNGDLNDPLYPALSPVVEILNNRRLGLISSSDSAEQIDALKGQDVRTDFEKYIYRTGINNQYAINVSGGSSKIKYSVMGGYDKSLQPLIGNDNRRITVRSNNSFAPIKNLEIDFGFAFTESYSRNNSIGNIDDQNYSYRLDGRVLYPYARFADEDGNSLATPKNYRAGYTDSAGSGKLLDWKYRTLDELKNSDKTIKLRDLVLTLGAVYKLTSFLSLSANYQYQNSSGAARSYFSDQTFYTRDLVNSFTQIQGNNVTHIVPNGGILDLDFSDLISHSGRTQLNFNKIWNGTHQVSGIIGGEIRDISSTLNTQRLYGFDPNTYVNSLVDYTNNYPLYGGRGSAKVPDRAGTRLSTNRFVSLYGNIAYNYKNRYTLSTSFRRDAANLFGVNVNNRWKPLWTIGTAWNLHEESFYKSSLFPYLRLRATFGYQGNVNTGPSPRSIITYSSYPNIANLPFASLSSLGNPELGWETVQQINIGIEFKLQQRIQGTIEAYRKVSNNLIWSKPIDVTTGIGSVKSNNASMVGKGLEITINTLNIKGPFQWSTELGYSYIYNEVTDYDKSLDQGIVVSGIVQNSGLSIRGIRGKSPYPIFSYPFAGLDSIRGDPQGYLGKQISKNYLSIFNQMYDTTSVIYHGSAIPTSVGFFNNIFRYKGVALIINIDYQLGYYFRKNTISYFNLIRRGMQHGDYINRWQVPGDEKSTTIPSFVYPTNNSRRDDFYAYSSVNVLKGDNIRLRNIKLSYSISQSSLKRLPIKSIQVYGNVENLGIIWRANKEGLDPDYNTGNAPFPLPKIFTMGISLDF